MGPLSQGPRGRSQGLPEGPHGRSLVTRSPSKSSK